MAQPHLKIPDRVKLRYGELRVRITARGVVALGVRRTVGKGHCLVAACAQYQAVQAKSWPSQVSTALETRPLRLLPICV